MYYRKITILFEIIPKKMTTFLGLQVPLGKQESHELPGGYTEARQWSCLDSGRHCRMQSPYLARPLEISSHSQLEIDQWDVRREGASRKREITLPYLPQM